MKFPTVDREPSLDTQAEETESDAIDDDASELVEADAALEKYEARNSCNYQWVLGIPGERMP